MTLEVGKTYRHFSDPTELYKIVERFGDIFIGESFRARNRYTFKEDGTALAHNGMTKNSCTFKIIPRQNFEFCRIADSSETYVKWFPLDNNAIFTDMNQLYLVREVDRPNTVRVITATELKKLNHN